MKNPSKRITLTFLMNAREIIKITLILMTLSQVVCPVKNVFAQSSSKIIVHNPERIFFDQIRINESTIQKGKKAYSNIVEIKSSAPKIEIECEIVGSSELAILDCGDLRVQFVMDTGANEFMLKSAKGKKLKLQVQHGPFETNVIHDHMNQIFDRYLQLYGDSVENLNNGKNIFVLNNIKKTYDMYTEQINVLSKTPSYYTLLKFRNIFSSSHSKAHLDLMSSTLSNLSGQLGESELAVSLTKAVKAEIESIDRNKLGNSVGIFSISKPDGTSFSNKSLTGKPYILAFSATWCGPCKEFIPVLTTLYDKYRDKDLEVVYINLHDDKEAWLKMIEDYNMKWTNVSELSEMSQSELVGLFNVRSIPNYILVDRHGKMIYEDKQLKDYDFEMLERYIIKALK
ncbi:TlpA family protein disulfide reductase [Sphingobacterium olei]|uniref:TlpA family protein disulfide reductase n=1 Tax=Sphingobacterium olei TaxID=2571155 RepID=A0A4V5MJI1_9SPHI|nr:TlpA disulfide reductase family protein [Sphingobacterium olei]TJZ49428.1 TlpA family protein disulfide reductase [Sphingobacterium olei]